MSLGGRKKGSIPWNKGIPMADASKKKLSKAKKGTPAWNRGKQMPVSMRQKMIGNTNGSGNKGRKMSDAWLYKLSVAKLGKPSFFKGKRHTPEVLKLMSDSRRKYLFSINPDYDYQLDSKTRKGNKRIRRERLKKFGGSHNKIQWAELKSRYNLTCPCCKLREPEIKLTRDHILSLSNGGSDNIENIQPLCVTCNSKKSTQTIKF